MTNTRLGRAAIVSTLVALVYPFSFASASDAPSQTSTAGPPSAPSKLIQPTTDSYGRPCAPPEFTINPTGNTDTQILGRLKRFVTPTYPPAALASGSGSEVAVALKLDLIGNVKEVVRVASQPASQQFDEATAAVAKYWTFEEPLDCDCAPKDGAEVSAIVTFAVEDGKPKISVTHRKVVRDGTINTPKFQGAKFVVLNNAEIRREIRYPTLARRAGVQAKLYARLEFDTLTGRVTKADINKVVTAQKFEWVFRQELEGTLEKFRIQPITESPDTLTACLPLVFRLTN